MGKLYALALYVGLTVGNGLFAAGRAGGAATLIAVVVGVLIWAFLIWATWEGSGLAWGVLIVGACIGIFNHWVFSTDGEDGASLIVPIALGIGQVVCLTLFRWRSDKE